MARILHVCASPDFAQYVDRLLPALVSAGHEVHFVSAPGEEPGRLLGGSDLILHTIPIVRSMAPMSDLGALVALSRLMHRLRPDLVHAHTPKGGLLGMLAARQMNVPARIYQMHGLRYETLNGLRRTLIMNCERIAATTAHRVICVSQSVRTKAMRDKIVSAKKSLVLSHGSAQGIQVEDYRREDWLGPARDLRKELGISGPCVVYLGRLAKDKGLKDLGAAWPQVHEQCPEAHLLLAGALDLDDLPDLTHLRALPNVHLLGPSDDPRPLLALATVMTLPSYREGLPQAILEAAAMQTPVVATRVTGVVDALQDGVGGHLIAAHDSVALARALIFSLEASSHLSGPMARNFVADRFHPRPILDQTCKLYESLLRGSYSPGTFLR